MLTKKHFIALADALRPVLMNKGREAEIIDALCDFMRSQNPQFKRDRWLAYLRGECGSGGGAIKHKAAKCLLCCKKIKAGDDVNVAGLTAHKVCADAHGKVSHA